MVWILASLYFLGALWTWGAFTADMDRFYRGLIAKHSTRDTIYHWAKPSLSDEMMRLCFVVIPFFWVIMFIVCLIHQRFGWQWRFCAYKQAVLRAELVSALETGSAHTRLATLKALRQLDRA